ncbi:hypothetical protein AALO_G00167340 [Alosa alosa]|uniref:Uncharacterized protein n=1 Tax=Alosa alosa TaxID=278164 RepID=A0AAV6GGU3_9TELE|nr:hypothetical protein AALO_G00167340 [Alosa alosa]
MQCGATAGPRSAFVADPFLRASGLRYGSVPEAVIPPPRSPFAVWTWCCDLYSVPCHALVSGCLLVSVVPTREIRQVDMAHHVSPSVRRCIVCPVVLHVHPPPFLKTHLR